ncbi:MAG: hypothetical protein K6G33_03275 [Ruminococcus sp.]|nr:putative Se/S carrier-like protein [Ruminococcus sp.]MCR5599751.1 hypothetical protein [Ruminococcus sp.]
MPSYTYAVKAQRLLRTRGYPCSIERRVRSSERSCGYSLIPETNCRAAAELLKSYNVPFSLRIGGGEDNDKL